MNIVATLISAFTSLAFAEPEYHLKPRCHSSSSLSSSSHHQERPVNCHRGRQGPTGKEGWPGPNGLIGPQGPSGVDGNNGTYTVTNSFINIYYSGPSIPLTDELIPFNNLQSLSSPLDFAQGGNNGVVALQPGVYLVTVNIALTQESSTSDPTAIGIFVNDVLVPQGKYWSTNGKYFIIGQALVSMEPGDEVTVKNLSEASAVLWDADVPAATLIASTASLIIIKVSNSTVLASGERIDG